MLKSKIKYLIVLLAGTFILLTWQACDDSILDQQPIGFTEATFFQNQEDFEEAVFGIYAKLTDLYWYNAGNPNTTLWILPGDDITTAAALNEEVFAPLDPTYGRVNNVWNALYELKNRSNVVLEKIESEGDVFADENLKNYYQGEALFLRSWAMFRLWNLFGAHAPLVDERINTIDNAQPSSSNASDPWGTELLDRAIQDLQTAADLLPDSWPEEDRGRVTSNTAYGLMGKALVFRASVTGNQTDYTDAISAFDNIQGVTLVDNYRDVSSNYALNNQESLFEFQASQPPGTDNVWLSNDFDITVGSMSTYWGFYSNDTGNWFAGSPLIPTEKLLNTYEEGDPRADYTVGPVEEPIADRSAVVKYVFDEVKTNTNAGSTNNPRILRYADILLLKAEAYLETGNPGMAIDLINQVRERARNSATPASAAPADRPAGETNAEVVFDWISEERYLELAGEEGHRWWDLRRWHKAGKIDLNNFDFSSVRSAFALELPKHLFLPIPQSELDANENIQQNEGY